MVRRQQRKTCETRGFALYPARSQRLALCGRVVRRAVSSVVEHYVDIVGVTSSNLVPPTNQIIPAGHKVKWVINSPHKEGIYTFTAPLANGAHVFVNNAFAGGVGAGMPCTTYAVK